MSRAAEHVRAYSYARKCGVLALRMEPPLAVSDGHMRYCCTLAHQLLPAVSLVHSLNLCFMFVLFYSTSAPRWCDSPGCCRGKGVVSHLPHSNSRCFCRLRSSSVRFLVRCNSSKHLGAGRRVDGRFATQRAAYGVMRYKHPLFVRQRVTSRLGFLSCVMAE